MYIFCSSSISFLWAHTRRHINYFWVFNFYSLVQIHSLDGLHQDFSFFFYLPSSFFPSFLHLKFYCCCCYCSSSYYYYFFLRDFSRSENETILKLMGWPVLFLYTRSHSWQNMYYLYLLLQSIHKIKFRKNKKNIVIWLENQRFQ